MLMIRLQRVGRKNDPSFRVVVVDSRSAAKTGKVIEVVGSHDARGDRTALKAERISYWLSVGAKVSATVNNLLVKHKVIEGKKIDVSSKKLGKKATAAKATREAAETQAATTAPETVETSETPTPTETEEVPAESTTV